ncbi:MAG: DNA polymerase III subunit delta [Chitinophagales bacterium]|nr:DNA polymerase III subunit delta [Chitinophagales bacterium]
MEELLLQIRKKHFLPVYFLHGEEPFFIDRIEQEVDKHALPEGEKGFNQTVLYGKDVDHLTLLDYLRRYPMMSERQVVILREAQEMKGLNELASYFENPMPTTVFVVCHKHKKADLRTKMGKSLQNNKQIALFESKKLYDNQVADWISTYCKSHHLSIEAPAAALLAEYLGADLARIANELDKLVLNIPANNAINTGHVQEYVGISKDYNIFELQKAMALRDKPKIARIQQYFAGNMRKNPLLVTVSGLFNYFSKVYVLHSLRGAPDAELLKALDLRSDWFLKEYKVAAANYTLAQTIAVIHLLKEFDLRSKGVDTDLTNTPEEDLMKELFWRILEA